MHGDGLPLKLPIHFNDFFIAKNTRLKLVSTQFRFRVTFKCFQFPKQASTEIYTHTQNVHLLKTLFCPDDYLTFYPIIFLFLKIITPFACAFKRIKKIRRKNNPTMKDIRPATGFMFQFSTTFKLKQNVNFSCPGSINWRRIGIE